MPMRLKSELYKKEQEEVIEKITSILDLQNKNTWNLISISKKNKKIEIYFRFITLFIKN